MGRAVLTVVSIYLQKHAVPIAQIPELFDSVRAQVQRMLAGDDGVAVAGGTRGRGKNGSAEPVVVPAGDRLMPVMAVSDSVKDDVVYCLVCAQPGTVLTRHVRNKHGLTVAEYRRRLGLPIDFPVVARKYSKERSVIGRQRGFKRRRKRRGEDGAGGEGSDRTAA